MGDYFRVEVVPVPPSEPNYREDAYGITIFRRRSRRVYIPPRPDSSCDLTGRRILKKYIGLKVSMWRTLWFDEESCEAPYDAKFLKPRVRAERGEVENASGNETVDNGEIRTRSATGSGEEEEDQGGKESEAQDGKAEDHETRL
ncbi:hypothetical protein V565_074510 [Rhizoctonia solani 123E]|uniref:Uncharacterized protein n=1 Tax=Rhizoctonia solani 123E TaxID=1423351 RepID=A0A074RUI2_9AGAM|nr:hypothetical protein V565_074510 [Rhizoctonia solani 123E]